MSLQSLLRGIRIGGSNEEVSAKATVNGSLVVAQNLPGFALLAAQGRGAWAQATAAVAGTTTIPTTTALGTLRNGEAGGGKSLVIDRIFANSENYDAGTHNFFFLWVVVHSLVGTLTEDITIHGLRSGNVVYGGSAQFDVGETVVDDGWFSVGNSVETNQGNAKGMSNIDYKMEGRIVLPPGGGSMSIHVGCNDSNLTFQVGVSWYEVQMDLG